MTAVAGPSGAGGAARVQGRVLPEHLTLEPPERRGRLDPELLVECLLVRRARGQRIRVPARPIERQHVLDPEPLTQRMPADLRLQFGDDIAVAPAREVRLDAPLERRQAQLLEAGAFMVGERLRELGERGPAPELERVA